MATDAPITVSDQDHKEDKSMDAQQHASVEMNEVATPAVATESRISTKRIVGFIALAYAASMIAQNAVYVATGAPDYGDPLDVVLAYHADYAVATGITTGLEAVNLPLLLLFVTALYGLVQRRGGAGANWSRLAVAAGATVAALFAIMMATSITTVLTADGLAEPTPTFALIWRLHAAVFALVMPALGATFIGAALATHASGLTRPWQRVLGLVGGGLLFFAGPGNLAVSDGSPLIYVGVLGLFIWIAWIIATGLRLIRG